MTLELVYINEIKFEYLQPRFEYGHTYKAISFTEDHTTFLDKDGVPMEFSNDTLHLNFRQKDKWREEQIEKILQ
jgi:hypothetical protein